MNVFYHIEQLSECSGAWFPIRAKTEWYTTQQDLATFKSLKEAQAFIRKIPVDKRTVTDGFKVWKALKPRYRILETKTEVRIFSRQGKLLKHERKHS